MAWNYSDPLSGALIAARANQSDLTFNSSLYKPFYSSYDPLISKFKTRPNYYNRPTGSINLFDDIDELSLEVEANNIFTSRYKPFSNNLNNYVPSYFNSNNKASLQDPNNDNNQEINNNINNNNTKESNSNNNNNSDNRNNNSVNNKIPQQPPGPSKQLKKPLTTPHKNKNTNNSQRQNGPQSQPIPQQHQQQQQPQNYQPSELVEDDYTRVSSPIYYQNNNLQAPFTQQSGVYNATNPNQIPVQTHNSQQQRYIQYQQRMIQQQQQQQQQLQQKQQPQNYYNDQNLSELEMLKIKQQQDRQQLLATLGVNQNYNNNNNNNNNVNQQQYPQQYQQFNQPFFQQFKHKQYSETSIPSTNADPLNSNNPTPPILTQRSQRNQQDFEKINNKNFYLKTKNNLQKSYDDEAGSYLNTLKEARLREQRLAKDKYTSNDYKRYQKNFGFGKDFLPFETETKQEKLEKARKRDEYAKLVKERNHQLNDNFTNPKFNGSYANEYYPVVRRNKPK